MRTTHVPFYDPPWSDAPSGSRECCIKKFEYPKSWKFMLESTGLGWFVGIQFEAEIEYQNHDAVPGCWCECCEFKQFVETTAKGKNSGTPDGKIDEKPPTPGEPHEDARDKKTDKNSGQTGKPPSKGNEQSFGSKESWPEPPEPPESGKSPNFQSLRTACTLKIIDTPGVDVDAGSGFNLAHTFTGRIYDKCQNNTVKATKQFMVEQSGIAPAMGQRAPPIDTEVFGNDSHIYGVPTHRIGQDGKKIEK